MPAELLVYAEPAIAGPLARAVRPTVESTIERSRRPLARQRTIRAVREQHGHARLVIGAGRRELDGWINTDVSWRATHHLDAAEPWPLPDDAVQLIYADNVIEHLTLDGGRTMLAEAARVLVPGGRIRIVTPDVERNVEHYLAGFDAAEELRQRHVERGYLVEHPSDFLRVIFCENEHWEGYLYDEAALAREMVDAGLTPERFEVGRSDTPELRGLEKRATPADRAFQLVLEGVAS